MTPKAVSIVIPSYNAARYLARCLDSLLVSATPQVEIILVDDGSTDGSADFVRARYADPLASGMLRLVEQANAGVSAARNAGIALASGRYLGFVDADDMVAPQYFTLLLEQAALDAADLIEFAFCHWDGESAPEPMPAASHRIDHLRRSQVALQVYGAAMWYSWNRWFKATLWHGIEFPVGVRFCEDMMTISRVFDRADSIARLSATLYRYRSNTQGATLTVRPDYVEHMTSYYLGMLDQRGDSVDLLKMSLQYTIFCCQRELRQPFSVPPPIQRDLRRLRLRFHLYRFIEPRRRLVLWAPDTYRSVVAFRDRLKGST